MTSTTAIEPCCGKCGQPLGSSFLYNGRSGYHHGCYPVSPQQARIAELERQLSEAVERAEVVEKALADEKRMSHGDWSNQRENDYLTIKLYEMKERAEKAEREVIDRTNYWSELYSVEHHRANAAEAEATRLREVLPLVETALSHASFALDGIVALDDEDMGKAGGSATCQAAKRTVDRALKSVCAALQGEPKP